MKKVLLFALTATMLALFGCTGDTNNPTTATSTSVTDPNPNTFNPKGTVSGLLRDAVDNTPIAGATVSISDKTAMTNAAGLFTIYNVPALTGSGNEPSTGLSAYPVVIDLTAVNVTRKAAGLKLYPSTAYTDVTPVYSSLGETSGGTTTTTNHDTPVDGFVANITPFVGKLAATIKMQVVNTSLVNVPDGTTVQIYTASATVASQTDTSTGTAVSGSGSTGNAATGGNVNGSTGVTGGGSPGVLVQTQKTVGGFVTFADLESRKTYVVKAFTADGTAEGWYGTYSAQGINGAGTTATQQSGASIITAPVDGLTDTYAVQGGQATGGPNGSGTGASYTNALVIGTVDGVAPFIIATSPTTLADIAIPTSGTLDVVYTFSEPIRSTNYANAITRDLATNNGGQGLYNDIVISYLGPKTGNIDHTLAWSTDRTKLTVSIPANQLSVASRYSIELSAALKAAVVGPTNRLVDANGNIFQVATRSLVTFSTAGNFNVAAPVINKTNSGGSLAIEWAAVSNAASYKVYVAITNIQPYASLPTAVNGTTVFAVTNFPTFNMLTVPGFSLANGRVYTVKVTTVNGGGSESVFSNEISFSDVSPAAPTAATKTAKATDVTSYEYSWPSVTGAVSYNVYVEPVIAGVGQGYGAVPTNVSIPYVNLAATIGALPATVHDAGSNFTLGQRAVVYNVKITAVTAYGSESTATLASAQVVDQTRATAATLASTVTTGVETRPVAAPVAGAATGSGTLHVTFTKPMKYDDLILASNWGISAPATSTGTSFALGTITVIDSMTVDLAYTYTVTAGNTMAAGNAPITFAGKTVTGLSVSNTGF
jgi:hypothetical protein